MRGGLLWIFGFKGSNGYKSHSRGNKSFTDLLLSLPSTILKFILEGNSWESLVINRDSVASTTNSFLWNFHYLRVNKFSFSFWIHLPVWQFISIFILKIVLDEFEKWPLYFFTEQYALNVLFKKMTNLLEIFLFCE